MKKIILNSNEINPYIRLAGYQGKTGWTHNRKIYDYEMLYFIKGQGSLEIDRKIHGLKKGSLILIPPNKSNKLYIEPGDSEVVWIHFDFFYFHQEGEIDYADFELKLKELIRPELYLSNGRRLPYCMYMKNKEEMEGLVENLLTTRKAEESFWQIRCKSIFLEILYHVLNQSYFDVGENQVLTKDRFFFDMQQYIHYNYRDRLTLQEISDYAGLSKNYANNIFKEKIGQTIIYYLNEYRLKKAIQLIRDSDYKIDQIAYQVGFSDGHYFSRVMKKHTGKRPGYYRQETSEP